MNVFNLLIVLFCGCAIVDGCIHKYIIFVKGHYALFTLCM